ncbi:hypothetical protein A0H81_14383, partial [Grifola frondosa]
MLTESWCLGHLRLGVPAGFLDEILGHGRVHGREHDMDGAHEVYGSDKYKQMEMRRRRSCGFKHDGGFVAMWKQDLPPEHVRKIIRDHGDMSNCKFRNDKRVRLGALKYVPHAIMKLLESIPFPWEQHVVCHAARKMRSSTLPAHVFSPFDDEEPPLDYGDNALNVEPPEATQLELDKEDATLYEWFYDPKPLIDTPAVNGPSYKCWSLALPVMANLYRLGRMLSSDQADSNSSYLFDKKDMDASDEYWNEFNDINKIIIRQRFGQNTRWRVRIHTIRFRISPNFTVSYPIAHRELLIGIQADEKCDTNAMHTTNVWILFVTYGIQRWHHYRTVTSSASMEKANKEKLDERLEEANKTDRETDVADALWERANYLTRIRDKMITINLPKPKSEYDVPPGIRLLALRHPAYAMFEHMLVYRGMHLLSIRQLKCGGKLLLDALSTFTATELLSYNDFVALTIITNVLTLERVDLKKKKLFNSSSHLRRLKKIIYSHPDSSHHILHVSTHTFLHPGDAHSRIRPIAEVLLQLDSRQSCTLIWGQRRTRTDDSNAPAFYFHPLINPISVRGFGPKNTLLISHEDLILGPNGADEDDFELPDELTHFLEEKPFENDLTAGAIALWWALELYTCRSRMHVARTRCTSGEETVSQALPSQSAGKGAKCFVFKILPDDASRLGRSLSSGLPARIQHAQLIDSSKDYNMNLKPVKTLTMKERKKSRFGNAFHLCHDILRLTKLVVDAHLADALEYIFVNISALTVDEASSRNEVSLKHLICYCFNTDPVGQSPHLTVRGP